MSVTQLSESLYAIADSCNVYVLVDGDEALIVDAGSGAVLDHLDELGVRRIEWVLHTHHHRDQCWGTPRLREHGARVAVPEYERHLFDQAEVFWQTRRTYDNYNDRSTFLTIGESIPVDAVLEDYERFEWRGHSFRVLPAKGHTYGQSALIAEIDGKRVAFTGDLLARDGKLADLHAMEYVYGSLEGLMFTLQSIQALRGHQVDLALPSHGQPITDVAGDIARLEQRIMDCVNLGQGMGIAGGGSDGDVPEWSFLPKLELYPISRHLVWGGPSTCSNFYVLLSDTGKALFIDYGLAQVAQLHVWADHEGLDTLRFVEHRLDQLAGYGVSEIDVVIPTHIHDDHTCGIPYLQRHHGTKCWALDEVATPLEDPAAWASTPCLLSKPIRIDRRLSDGERFEWQEYSFEIHHAPGQTEFHSVLAATIDGRKVAFTGDNYFMAQVPGGEQRPYQTTVMRNSFQLAMHRRCAEVMRELSPELICPGHGPLLPCTEDDIDAYCDFIDRKEAVFRELVGEPADQHIDLFWARLLPYMAEAQPGEAVEYRLLLRNNLERPATYAARLRPPRGWSASPSFEELELEPGARGTISLRASVDGDADSIRRLMTAEIRIDGEGQGPVCEALVRVAAAGAGPPTS